MRNIDLNIPIKIYVLIDPRNNRVRYVGWTHSTLKERLHGHISDSKRGNNHKQNWIRELAKENLIPIIETIEETIYSKRVEREQYWIKYYGRENLVNGTDGGEGKIGAIASDKVKEYFSKLFSGEGNPFYGKHHTEETLDKLRNRKMSDETKEKLIISNTGRKKSKEELDFRSKLFSGDGNPFYGKHHDEEAKEKNRIAHLGRVSPNKGKRTGIPSPWRGKKPENSSSRFMGVTHKKPENIFTARVHHDGKRIYLIGSHREPDAAIAYDLGAIFYYGKDSNLNFPDSRQEYIDYLSGFEIIDIKDLRKLIKEYISSR